MRQIQVFFRILTVTIHGKPANMCKECRMNSREYFLNIYNKSSRRNSRELGSVNQGGVILYCKLRYYLRLYLEQEFS